MGLVLALRVGEGFTVGERLFVVASIAGPRAVMLRPPAPGEMLRVVAGVPYPLGQSVTVRIGQRGQGRMARLVIEAPEGIAVRKVPAER